MVGVVAVGVGVGVISASVQLEMSYLQKNVLFSPFRYEARSATGNGELRREQARPIPIPTVVSRGSRPLAPQCPSLGAEVLLALLYGPGFLQGSGPQTNNSPGGFFLKQVLAENEINPPSLFLSRILEKGLGVRSPVPRSWVSLPAVVWTHGLGMAFPAPISVLSATRINSHQELSCPRLGGGAST